MYSVVGHCVVDFRVGDALPGALDVFNLHRVIGLLIVALDRIDDSVEMRLHGGFSEPKNSESVSMLSVVIIKKQTTIYSYYE